MTDRAWLALDWCGHHIPIIRFGRVRAYICDKADAAIWRSAGEPPNITLGAE